MKTIAYDVFLRGDLIDTVFYNEFCDGGARITKKDVKESLINHDGYDYRIKVKMREEDKFWDCIAFR